MLDDVIRSSDDVETQRKKFWHNLERDGYYQEGRLILGAWNGAVTDLIPEDIAEKTIPHILRRERQFQEYTGWQKEPHKVHPAVLLYALKIPRGRIFVTAENVQRALFIDAPELEVLVQRGALQRKAGIMKSSFLGIMAERYAALWPLNGNVILESSTQTPKIEVPNENPKPPESPPASEEILIPAAVKKEGPIILGKSNLMEQFGLSGSDFHRYRDRLATVGLLFRQGEAWAAYQEDLSQIGEMIGHAPRGSGLEGRIEVAEKSKRDVRVFSVVQEFLYISDREALLDAVIKYVVKGYTKIKRDAHDTFFVPPENVTELLRFLEDNIHFGLSPEEREGMAVYLSLPPAEGESVPVNGIIFAMHKDKLSKRKLAQLKYRLAQELPQYLRLERGKAVVSPEYSLLVKSTLQRYLRQESGFSWQQHLEATEHLVEIGQIKGEVSATRFAEIFRRNYGLEPVRVDVLATYVLEVMRLKRSYSNGATIDTAAAIELLQRQLQLSTDVAAQQAVKFQGRVLDLYLYVARERMLHER